MTGILSNTCKFRTLIMARFSRPKLLYDYDALEPHIDAKTMEIHHTKHHETYVVGVNKLSSSVPSGLSLHGLLRGATTNDGLKPEDKEILMKYGGGHYNHSLFWEYMSPKSNMNDISGILKQRITTDFGGIEKFKDEFDKAAASVFGSGWAWWVFDYQQSKSYIVSTKDQINPIMDNEHLVCLLGLDVWEHAYYLKFQNQRQKYINSFWNVVNWNLISKIHDDIVGNNGFLEVTDDGYIKFD